MEHAARNLTAGPVDVFGPYETRPAGTGPLRGPTPASHSNPG